MHVLFAFHALYGLTVVTETNSPCFTGLAERMNAIPLAEHLGIELNVTMGEEAYDEENNGSRILLAERLEDVPGSDQVIEERAEDTDVAMQDENGEFEEEEDNGMNMSRIR